MADHILAIDQGTTSTRALVFDPARRVVGSAQRELVQHYPADGWVEPRRFYLGARYSF